ncbi:MAG: glutamyl-tRNA reductase [Firmicutes bacterium HGW-Firmicutes-1]|jgi:glutamyl-tRNA reductase|nr:MAG: glutamyl-tRNA reductase [Firmicutes bacterium HGW-Firmicutes-1]
MNIGVVGISHKQASVEIREKIAFTDSKKIEVMNQLLDLDIEEVVIVSTCNRSEIYYACSENEGMAQIIKNYLVVYFQSTEIMDYFFDIASEAAIEHLYTVTSGLDSVILGEDQILGQVKDSLEFSNEIGASKKFLNRIFRETITFAKRMKKEYKISENPLSIASVAVKLLSNRLEQFKDAHVLIIGAGEIGQLCAKYLLEYGVKYIYMCNRNQCKLEEISSKNPYIQAVLYEDRYKVLPLMDVVISATASPHMIIKSERLPTLSKNITFVDMAVPMDIDREIGKLKGVHLLDIDDLREITDNNKKHREEIAEKVKALIDDEVKLLHLWIHQTRVDHIIESFHEICLDSKEDTMLLIQKKLKLNAREYAFVDKLVNSAIKRVIREPIKQLKAMEDEEEIQKYKEMIHKLFDF